MLIALLGGMKTLKLFAACLLVVALGCAGDGDAPVDAGGTTSGGLFGAGGVGEAVCQLGTANGCAEGEKCSVVGLIASDVGCVSAGAHPVNSVCADDTDCDVGLFCSPKLKTCRRLCDTDADCGEHAFCKETGIAPDKVSTKVFTCSTACDLVTGAPCDDAFGPTKCKGGTACYGTGFDDKVAEEECSGSHISCGPGTVCLTPLAGPPGTCRAYCYVDQPQCPPATSCQPWKVVNGTHYGWCLP